MSLSLALACFLPSLPESIARRFTWPRRLLVEDDDAARHRARLHLVEGLVDLLDTDPLADHVVELELAREVEVDIARHVDAEVVRAHVRTLERLVVEQGGGMNTITGSPNCFPEKSIASWIVFIPT